MFVTSKRFEEVVSNLRSELRDADKHYWDLWLAHGRLMSELGYYEHYVSSRIELRRKDGPEPSE